MIKGAVLQPPDALAKVSIALWESLASELIAIIGEGGFQSLYSRSIYLVKPAYPWLALKLSSPQTGSRFAGLHMSFEGRNITEIGEANIALLICFTDILSGLIGEILTTSILRAAWGDDAFNVVEEEFGK